MENMQYFEDINAFFTEKASQFFVEGKVPFNNGFEASIFYLTTQLLKDENTGAFFINVPTEELGPNNHTKHYTDFCNAVLVAAGQHVFKNNAANEIPENNTNDIIYKKWKPKSNIFLKRNGCIPLSGMGTREEHVEISGAHPKLQPMDLFSYNKSNAEASIKNYFSWLDSMSFDQKIVNNIKNKVLIISHGEIEKSFFANSIPYCSIDESGKITHSSPIEPMIYLARDENEKLISLIRSKDFDSIIVVGDRKFKTGGIKRISNKYFNRIIYIGTQEPTNQLKTFYTYSPDEIRHLYDISTSSFSNEIIEHQELNESIKSLIAKTREVKETGGEFKFSLLRIFNRTAPIDEEIKKYWIENFENSLLENLVVGEENQFNELQEAYEAILVTLAEGNIAKIKYVQNTIKNNKIERIFLIVNDKDEISYFKKIFKLKIDQIILRKSYLKKSKKIKNHLGNKYIFLSFDKSYHEILKAMDRYLLMGNRIFLSIAENDPRFLYVNKSRKKYELDFLTHLSREAVTGIKYVKPSEEETEGKDLTLDNYTYDDNFDSIIAGIKNIERFRIEFDEGEPVTLDGSVIVDDELIDVADIEKNDEIKYYQNNPKLFDSAWQQFAPTLAADIEKYSCLWKSTLLELNSFYKKNDKQLFEALLTYGWKTEITSLKAYLREGTEIQFPRVRSLEAIKKLCSSIENFENCDFIQEYSTLRKAQNANESRKKLGRILSNALLQDAIGNTSDEPFIKKISTLDLFTHLKEKCIQSGTVKNKTKI